MTKQYVNKFHNFKFQTDAKKDLEEHSPKLNTHLSNEIISDDCSNEMLLQYRYAANSQKSVLNKDE